MAFLFLPCLLKKQQQQNNNSVWAAARSDETMVLDLMYLCCLTQDEAYMARQIIQQWLYENYPFSVDVSFDQLQCWQTTEQPPRSSFPIHH